MKQAIKVAILDAVPEVYWADDLGITDGQKFVELLQPLNSVAQYDIYYVSRNQFPQDLGQYDAILVTGSPCSVHDDYPWIGRLVEMIQSADSRQQRIIGSCFGHQLVARAFGGEVGYNEQGWVIGNFEVHINRTYDWMLPVANTTGLYHFNQERVTRLPQGAVSFAHTEDYADYGFTLGDNILCFQGHPEQPRRAMVNFLKAMDSLSPQELATAEQRIHGSEPDSQIWGEWMTQFLLSRR